MVAAETKSYRWAVVLSALLDRGASVIAQSRQAIADQELRRTLSASVWIRIPHGHGVICDGCGKAVASDEALYEIGNGRVMRLDRSCFDRLLEKLE